VLEEQMQAFAMLGAEWVLYLLVLLSIVCVGVAVERVVYSVLNTSPGATLEPLLTRFLADGDAQALATGLDKVKGIDARVLKAGAEAGARGGADSAEEALAGAMVIERTRLSRGLIIIGSTGANAPFIGLFGTVLGIMRAFADLSMETDEAAASVMAGISEALVATAVGLLVAIPAVVLFNTFTRRNKEQIARTESLGHTLLSVLRRRPSEDTEPGVVRSA